MTAPRGPHPDKGVVTRIHPQDVEALADALATRLQPSPWLDAAEAAVRLRCKKRRVYDLVQQNRIPHRREGARLLFRADELDAWLDSGSAADADTVLTPGVNCLENGSISGPQRIFHPQVRGADRAA